MNRRVLIAIAVLALAGALIAALPAPRRRAVRMPVVEVAVSAK